MLEPVAVARRLVTTVAALSFIGLVSANFSDAADHQRGFALTLTSCLLLLLGLAVAALVVSDSRALARVDVGVLVVGIVCTGAAHLELFRAVRNYPSDEGTLGALAISEIIHGQNPYTFHFPQLADTAGNTPLMGGGSFDRYGYPPLSAEIGAGLGRIWTALGQPGPVSALALLATTVICFVLLPRDWRSLAPLVVLGLGQLTTFAVNGHPVIVALPLLCLACRRWTSIGAGARLGRSGVLQAVALGLACASQQLAWFVTAGVLLAVLIVRRGELPARRALAVTGRFTAITLGAFVAANLPFIIANPADWAGGLLVQFTLHAVAAGQGLVMVATVLLGHSGHLEFLSYATALLYLALLAVIAVAFRRVALAVPIMLAVIYAVALRSQVEYFVAFLPLWLVWAFAAEPAAVQAARPFALRLGSLERRDGRSRPRPADARTMPRSPWVALAALTLAVLPAVGCVIYALASPAPLRLRVVGAQLDGVQLTGLRVSVRNMTDGPVRPSFYLDTRSHLKSAWQIIAGPTTIRAHHRAVLQLQPGPLGAPESVSGLRLWALSDGPAALSSSPLASSGMQVALVGTTRLGPIRTEQQQCLVQALQRQPRCQ